MKNTNKRILALLLTVIMFVGLITPAFAAINVEGQGGSNVSLGSVSGQNTYNNADQMWKVTLFYARQDSIDGTSENSPHLGNRSYWRKYGDSIYVYHPTANRGASGKINMNFFKSALFYYGNKAEILYQSGGDISKLKDLNLSIYDRNHFYADTSSPAIAMNTYTIDPVKAYFRTATTLQKMIKEITRWKKGSWTSANFYSLLDEGNTAFAIDGFNSVDKTTNGGKAATTGYKWSSSKYLNGSDWVYGVKKDYNGKQIYIYPTSDGDTMLNAVGWMVVYEPVLCIGPNKTAEINGKTYNNIACTPTEYAILQYYGIIDVGPWLDDTVFDYLSNSTYLDEKWGGMPARSSKFTVNTSMNTIFREAGVGMAFAHPHNYVIKDYEMKISVPKTAKTGEAFSVKYYATNKSKDNNRNTGNTNNPITVNFVWVARVYNGTNEYWFDLWNLRNKTLTTSNALKNGSTLVTTYSEAAKIIEARRSSEDGKPKYKISAKTQNKWEDYTYTLDSAFSGYTFEVRACVNTDTDGNNAFAKKELNSGAYYKSGETDSWGNNYVKKSVKITSVPEVEPVIGVQLNNTTNNSEIDLGGKRFAVWCIGGTQMSQVKGTAGAYKLLPCTNTSNSGFIGIIETDENGYGEINLADANVGSGQDIYGTSNTTADRTATGISHGYFGSSFTNQGAHWMPGEQNKKGETYFLKNDYWKGNTVLFEHPAHSAVDTSKYTLNSDNTVTNKSTGKVVTEFTPSYQIRASKADGYSENCLPLRTLGWHNQYLVQNGTLAQMYGVVFGGGNSTGNDGKSNYYYHSSNKMTFVIRPIDDSYDETTKYNYGGKELKVYGYVNENGTAVTTQEERITFSKIKAVYDSSFTGTTVTKPQTTNYFLNTEIANCPIKNGVLTLDGSKVIYEDLIVFNLTPKKTEKVVDIDITEDPGTVTVNYKKGTNCTVSSFQGVKVRLTDSKGVSKEGTLNTNGTVTFTNVPTGPFSVVPVVKGDTNLDGNLCACDGSITQLNTAIDVSVNIYSTGHYITPFQTDSSCDCELYKVASLGETTYIHLAKQSGVVYSQENTTVDFTVDKKVYTEINPIVKVNLKNFTETETVVGKKFGIYAVFFNDNSNKYGINLSSASKLGTITIDSASTDEEGNQVGSGTLNLSTQANTSFLSTIKSNRVTNETLWGQLNTDAKKFGAFFDNSSGSPIYDAEISNNLILVVRPLTSLAKDYQTYDMNGSLANVFVPSTYSGKTYSANWCDYETDEDGNQYVTNNHLGYFSSSSASASTCLYEDYGIINFTETSTTGDYLKEITFNMYEPKAGINVNLNKTTSLHTNDNPAITITNKNNGTSKTSSVTVSAGNKHAFEDLHPNSYTVSVSGLSSPYSISPASQNADFNNQAAIDAGTTLNYTVDVKGTINLNFKLDGSYWATADNVNGKTVTLYKDGEALQTKTISNMRVSFTGIAINNSSFTFSINGGISCHTFNLPTVSADEIKNTYSSTTAKYTVTKECKISYNGCVGKYNIVVNYLDGATFANVGSKITFALNNANSKTSTKSTDTKSVAEYGNLALNGSVASTTAYNVTAQCSDSNYSITLVSGDPTNTVADFRNLHSSGHTITLTYEVKLVKRELKFNLTSSITKPTLFNSSTYWSTPIGQTVTVTLYNSSNTLISTKTVTIADNGTTSCSFGTVGAGTYTIKVTTNCSDIGFFTNNEYTTVCTQYSVTQSMGSTTATTVNGYSKNYIHKIKVTYTTDQDTGLKGNYFTVKVTNPSGSTTSSVISNDVEYIVPYGVGANINTYTITQTTAPENYEKSENIDTFKPTLNKNETHIASFSNKYIWDFSIVISVDKDFAVVGDKINYTVVIKNKRPKSASPSLQIYWDNTVKQNETVTVAANSTVTKTYSYTIPTTEVVGGHILTAYTNQDLKYYEINTSDNISQCSISMGGNFIIEGLTPDTEYMRGYEAVASCYVSSDIPKDTLAKDNLDVDAKLKYTAQNGTVKTVNLARYENLVVPSNVYVDNKNIAYFKFTIPSDAKINSQAEVIFTVNPDKTVGEYDYTDNTASIKNIIIDKIASNPETLGRELKIPTGYYGSTITPEISSATGERSWSQWSEKSDGTLQIDTYTTNTSIDSVVKIDNRCISAIWENNNLNMRSGYAFTIRTHPMITVNKNGSAYSEDRMITTFQSARVYYPEFRYNQELGRYTELEVVNSSNSNTSQFSVYSPYFLDKNTGKSKYANTQDVGMVSSSVSRYELPINDVTSFQELGRKHFIPIFWKDGEYNLQLYATQLWCPVGVVSTYDYAKTSKGGTVIVEGSVYDDYYTVRG